MDDALEVKDIEKVSNHDVNAVEYLLKWQSHPDISKVKILPYLPEIACYVVEFFAIA